MFNIKDDKLPPGALIRFELIRYDMDSWLSNERAMVLLHRKPVYLQVLVRNRIIDLSFVHRVPIHGWINEFSLLKLPPGYTSCPKWHPSLHRYE